MLPAIYEFLVEWVPAVICNNLFNCLFRFCLSSPRCPLYIFTYDGFSTQDNGLKINAEQFVRLVGISTNSKIAKIRNELPNSVLLTFNIEGFESQLDSEGVSKIID